MDQLSANYNPDQRVQPGPLRTIHARPADGFEYRACLGGRFHAWSGALLDALYTTSLILMVKSYETVSTTCKTELGVVTSVCPWGA
jgi:hypothetical protein